MEFYKYDHRRSERRIWQVSLNRLSSLKVVCKADVAFVIPSYTILRSSLKGLRLMKIITRNYYVGYVSDILKLHYLCRNILIKNIIIFKRDIEVEFALSPFIVENTNQASAKEDFAQIRIIRSLIQELQWLVKVSGNSWFSLLDLIGNTVRGTVCTHMLIA